VFGTRHDGIFKSLNDESVGFVAINVQQMDGTNH
jgi:hypothetical protein